MALQLNFLRRSLARKAGSHIYLGKYQDYNQWENIPSKKLESSGAIPIVGSHGVVDHRITLKKLRGTGLHGPEYSSVLKLILWNRLKQKQPQREVPSEAEMGEWNKLEVSCVWFTWGFLLFYWPMAIYGGHYASEHDHYPWMPERTDASRGEGGMFWFLE